MAAEDEIVVGKNEWLLGILHFLADTRANPCHTLVLHVEDYLKVAKTLLVT